MKFSVLVAIIPEELEKPCTDAAKELGAGGITILSGRGISNTPKKTLFGLSFEGGQTVLVMVLEKGLSLEVMKCIQNEVMPDGHNSKGVVFTVPLEHLGGIDPTQVEQFEDYLRDKNS